MSNGNVTIDARDALQLVIKKRYGRDITDLEWATVVPSDDPPDGLGSQDTTDWEITLDRATKTMASSYVMAAISRTETETARKGDLNTSVDLLVSKASDQSDSSSLKIRSQHVMLGVGAGLLAGTLVTLSAAFKSSKKAGR